MRKTVIAIVLILSMTFFIFSSINLSKYNVHTFSYISAANESVENQSFFECKCDDNNPCTVDECVENFCRHTIIPNCCGNGICEGDEFDTCPIDCKEILKGTIGSVLRSSGIEATLIACREFSNLSVPLTGFYIRIENRGFRRYAIQDIRLYVNKTVLKPVECSECKNTFKYRELNAGESEEGWIFFKSAICKGVKVKIPVYGKYFIFDI